MLGNGRSQEDSRTSKEPGPWYEKTTPNSSSTQNSVSLFQYPASTRSADWSTTNYIPKSSSRTPASNCKKLLPFVGTRVKKVKNCMWQTTQ